MRKATIAVARASLCLLAACSTKTAPIQEKESEVNNAEQVAADLAEYQTLDNVEGDYVNLNPTPVRPMLWVTDADGAPHVYAANAYLNTVVHFDATTEAIQTFPTLAAPVSVARYTSGTTDWLLVVCQHSDALVIHDFASGAIEHVVAVPGEPADVVVDGDAGVAFVSAMGTNEVVEIDLTDPNRAQRRYAIDGRRPAFLTLDADGNVFVAPMVSGNNSGVRHLELGSPQDPRTFMNPQASQAGIVDFEQVADQTLPDGDLFWLDRAGGTAVPVVVGAGSVLNAHGFHPNGEHWMLNVAHNNKDPQRQLQADIQGEISFNRVSISRLPAVAPGVAPVRPRTVNIDDTDLSAEGIQYDRSRTAAMPYSIAFSESGLALVAGLMSDNVTVLDAAGNRLAEWNLPDGCVPRQVMLDPQEFWVLTYCSGLNTIHVNLAADVAASPITLDLGYDPTPEAIRAGRILFYDASHSLHNTASCATCHIEGGVDGIAWNLGSVTDDKGPMTTQSLESINVTAPFHWRGEQLNGLSDFRGAFPGLLGGRDLSDEEFIAFEAFVLSLETPPNPHQNRQRLLDDSIQPSGAIIGPGIEFPQSSAINGQALYVAPRCNQCHQLPVGSDHEANKTGAGFGEPNPRRQFIKVAPLITLPDRGIEPLLPVTFADGQTRSYPRVGTGLAHAGNPKNIWEFGFLLNPTIQDALDVTNFLFQFDTGLAPATRARVRIDGSADAAALAEVNGYLLPEAHERDADVAAFGSIGRYYYDRGARTFIDEAGVSWTLDDLATQVADLDGWLVFAGLPVGTGRRFAIDYDGDEVLNALDENPYAFEPSPITDDVPPILTPAAPRPLWMTKRVGRINFETHELTQWRLDLTPDATSGFPAKSFERTTWGRTHSVVFRDLEPGQTYAAVLTVTDRDGDTTVEQFTLAPRPRGDTGTVLTALDVTATINDDGTTTFAADVEVANRITSAPESGQVVVLRALVNGVVAGSALSPIGFSNGTDFCVEATNFNVVLPYSTVPGAVPGPFGLSSTTDAQGRAQASLVLGSLSSGDEVVIDVQAIAAPTVHSDCPLPTTFSSPAAFGPVGWSMPDTHAHLRSVTLNVP